MGLYPLKSLDKLLAKPGRTLIAGAPGGFDALVLGDLVSAAPGRLLLHVARDDARMALLAGAIGFFRPEIDCLQLPAWDCLPYDRVSPNPEIVSQRMDTLTRLAAPRADDAGPRIVLTTVNAMIQRVPAREALTGARLEIAAGGQVELEILTAYLEDNGYTRSGTAMEAGEYAPRGGIVDIYPAGAARPVRLDMFGDQIESIREFDPVTQISAGRIERFVLRPVSEIRLDNESIARFRAGYRELFGAMTAEDPLYESIGAGHRHVGMEHWLPLFHESLETVPAYVAGAPVSFDPLIDEAREERFTAVADYYAARRDMPSGAAEMSAVYRPIPPDRLYLDAAGWDAMLADRAVVRLSPFHVPDSAEEAVIDAGGKPARDFTAERAQPDVNLFDALRDYIAGETSSGRRVLIACYSTGSRDRLVGVLRDHGVESAQGVEGWAAARDLASGAVGLVVLALDRGFETGDTVVLSEQDVLGDRLARPPRRARRADAFIAEVSSLDVGDIVVHADHGIGRYEGLETLTLNQAPHDCVLLVYAGDDKLYVPVENIEVLSRYGAGDAAVQLDKLGGVQWQARKAKLKQRIKEMAEELIRVAAQRRLRTGAVLRPADGLYEEFCARFPFVETEDQQRAIEQVIDDLGAGRPMDRLVCGDVGFGKTEVALRAAFISVMAGKQVAMVVPTTLLSRQHYATFRERFAGLPVNIAQLSRMVAPKKAAEVKTGLENGRTDIVIGTHALLSKSVVFRDLGLLVVDEEQHFGVAHKERLKQMRTDVHVLTLTATPIPRTLQLALAGVRELSLIATAPVDRLAVRTFIMPYDPVIVREAILREHFRGGQSFFVCPRIKDLDKAARRLRELVPEVKVAIAHGRMASADLEKVMNAFYDGAYDVLVSTAIIESGLDIPNANTIVIYRAHMFGLGQLYQLRGRIGRAKVRAYAYLTLPPEGGLTAAAGKRLEVMHKLDTLGAGFSLASYDLDIRGAGNLLGSEQSGHIREVGIELYQRTLEEAVRQARAAEAGTPAVERAGWSPQIAVGTAVLIPEAYVADLGVRMGLYRRLADLESRAEIDAFAAELIDRFGSLPGEVENLLKIVALKALCREAGVAKFNAGDRGALIVFHENSFADPAGLVAFIGLDPMGIKLRPDHTLVIRRNWDDVEMRLAGATRILTDLAQLVRDAA